MQKMRAILLPEDRSLSRLEGSQETQKKIHKAGLTKNLQPKLNSKETVFECFDSVKNSNKKFKTWGNSIKLGSKKKNETVKSRLCPQKYQCCKKAKTPSPRGNIVHKVMFNM